MIVFFDNIGGEMASTEMRKLMIACRALLTRKTGGTNLIADDYDLAVAA